MATTTPQKTFRTHNPKPTRVPVTSEELRYIDYKNTDLLKKLTDPYGRVIGHRRTELNAKQQREMSNAIKRARFLALLPFVAR